MKSNDSHIEQGVETFILPESGAFPNSNLPVVVYWQAIALAAIDPASSIEERYHDQGWDGVWRNGILPEHHYHSAAHEVLGIAKGSVRVMLGGPDGKVVDLEAGDVAVLPAGTAHQNIRQTDDLLVVGGYPSGQRPDMLYGAADDRPAADRAIADVPLPLTDPVLGQHGPLVGLWQLAANKTTATNS